MSFPKLYPAQANSLQTILTKDISPVDTSIMVLDTGKFPSAPNYLVLGGDSENAETILMKEIVDANHIIVERGVEGLPQVWAAETKIGRNFTAADHNSLISCVADLKVGVQRISNPNLLINPNFAINQRGQSTYNAIGYTCDGWSIVAHPEGGSLSVSLNNNAVTLTKSSGIDILGQVVENSTFLRGKTVTLSVQSQDGNIAHLTYSIPLTGMFASPYQYIGDTGFIFDLYFYDPYVQVRIYSTEGSATASLTAVKLELGAVSTLAHDAPPDPALELAKCQRYLLPLEYPLQCRTVRAGNNTMDFFVPTPVTMRNLPTIVQDTNLLVRGVTGGGESGFTFACTALLSSGVMIRSTKAAHGLTDGQLVVISSTAFLDANL